MTSPAQKGLVLERDLTGHTWPGKDLFPEKGEAKAEAMWSPWHSAAFSSALGALPHQRTLRQLAQQDTCHEMRTSRLLGPPLCPGTAPPPYDPNPAETIPASSTYSRVLSMAPAPGSTDDSMLSL
ncbi:Hypothetical predicted protein [Marmota monax]|uniref:Uncharacterized protein n=1 Tax=Marmota monax TaxID=9995 RepID=A0A5E4AY26_MARMO|nr:hypothetical protein GHT09_016778 [Marmota monax]VTJ61746.1 Hypothetical predicted protein [Marmota monax]